MASDYYKPCKELDECEELINKYYLTAQYDKCFEGHLKLAEKGYPLAECQIGYFYLEGLGVEKDIEKAFYWTERAAEHGDRDSQYNLAEIFYEEGLFVERDMEKAKEWYRLAANDGHADAKKKYELLYEK
ncbi:Sel1 repeat-containing protein [Hathewaya proteolytica DSM 3090]|uniref:Sel1 repeat-containing protein n=1 Tax=Hathewaya proteolytica DSM 3090 TaxID=1121331 RepID=A0A1M6MWU1_9CLOT|nr:tetratricopeptide repeat protein [Hathewaya proteolytica]SHJ87894.1 Sel1 repeat-containing protein [Hathewaya proteolytica DSM 3090]